MTDVTEHATTPAVTHEDGDQNGSFIRLLSTRIPAGLGGALVALLTLLIAVAWVWSLVVTWIGHTSWFLPLFPTTVAGALVLGAAVYGRKTLAWLLPLLVSALWVWVSVEPLQPAWNVVLQAVTVALLVAATVIAVVAAQKSEEPRF